MHSPHVPDIVDLSGKVSHASLHRTCKRFLTIRIADGNFQLSLTLGFLLFFLHAEGTGKLPLAK